MNFGTLKHPTPEQLKPLLDAVDVAIWAWAVKLATIKGTKCRADWRGALQDLAEAWGDFQLSCDNHVLVESRSSEKDVEGK